MLTVSDLDEGKWIKDRSGNIYQVIDSLHMNVGGSPIMVGWYIFGGELSKSYVIFRHEFNNYFPYEC